MGNKTKLLSFIIYSLMLCGCKERDRSSDNVLAPVFAIGAAAGLYVNLRRPNVR